MQPRITSDCDYLSVRQKSPQSWRICWTDNELTMIKSFDADRLLASQVAAMTLHSNELA